jgi:putative tryptophan/tyrosine transport system substrate-binding protein
MRRRAFIEGIAVLTAALPFVARAQSVPPMVGYLAQAKPEEGITALVAANRNGLSETGLVEGKDYISEFRSAGGDANLLPGLASELVQHGAAVIMTLDTLAAARAAKAVTTAVPIVFATGADPLRARLVESLNRPSGNITGISAMNLELGSKWVGLLHELLPAAKRIAIFVNIENAEAARLLITDTQEAAFSIGLQTEFVFASNEGEIEPALSGLGARSQGLIIQPDVAFRNSEEVAGLAVREKLPALAAQQDFAKGGGLMSYGSSFVEAHRLAGTYVGRILKGEKPGDLPVQRAIKFDFVINLKTAKAIGLDIPPTLLARADVVIE